MFDINKIINDTIAAAVSTHITTLQQEYANKMAEMAQQIAALEAQSANRHERLRVLEGALTDRVAALENNPAQGVDTTLEEAAANKDKHERQLFVLQHLTARIAALETKLTEADLFTKTTEVHINKDELLEYLDNQEWFWDKLRRFTDGAVEQAVEQHCEDYDHDDMLMKPDMDDYIKREDFDSEVRDAVRDTLEDARIHLRY